MSTSNSIEIANSDQVNEVELVGEKSLSHSEGGKIFGIVLLPQRSN